MLAFGVFILSVLLLWEITRRMTAARNDALAVFNQYLIPHGIDVVAITGKRLPEKFKLNYDREELSIYVCIVFISAWPAFLLWLF